MVGRAVPAPVAVPKLAETPQMTADSALPGQPTVADRRRGGRRAAGGGGAHAQAGSGGPARRRRAQRHGLRAACGLRRRCTRGSPPSSRAAPLEPSGSCARTRALSAARRGRHARRHRRRQHAPRRDLGPRSADSRRAMAPPRHLPAESRGARRASRDFPDRHAPRGVARLRGHEALRRGRGARRARHGFPHVVGVALPTLRDARESGRPERDARLDALVALVANVDDTCLLHRGGRAASRDARNRARAVLAAGVTVPRRVVARCGRWRRRCWATTPRRAAAPTCSPATLFLDALDHAAGASSRRLDMETLDFNYPASQPVPRRAHVGVVGSGDLEVLLEPSPDERATSGAHQRRGVRGGLEAVLDRLLRPHDRAAVEINVYDAGHPGTVALRLAQAVKESARSRDRADAIDQSPSSPPASGRRAVLDQGTFRELIGPFERFTSPHLETQGMVPRATTGWWWPAATSTGTARSSSRRGRLPGRRHR